MKLATNITVTQPSDAYMTLTLPQTGQVPEAPYAILLPLGALGLLAGGYVVARKRRTAQAAA
jgi:hypothetical protein